MTRKQMFDKYDRPVMKYTAQIKEVATGKIVEYHDEMEGWDDDYPDSPWHSIEFIWSEGNYSCDCNRALFFARGAQGTDEPDVPCGETMYRCRITLEETGEVILDEWNNRIN
jgi:hypothetical protein